MTNTTIPRTDPKIEAIQRVYAAFGRGDLEAVLAELADDVDWASEATTTSAPWYGKYAGKGEVPRFFGALGTSVETKEFIPLSFTANDTDVMVVIHWTITARATGRTATMQLHHWWRFADDKIVYYRGSDDSELTATLFA